MDMMRSCYDTQMQFDAAGHIVRGVRWYFADTNARYLPFPHKFGSQNWLPRGSSNFGIGERWQAKPVWNNGALPYFSPGTGARCGSDDWFANGTPSNAPNIPVGPDNVPLCCPQKPCQPWNNAIVPAGSFIQRVSTGQFWSIFPDTTFQCFGSDISGPTPGTLQFQVLITTPLCLGFFPTSGQLNLNPFFGYIADVKLVAYDANSRTGTWQVPSDAPEYAGELFRFHRGLS